MASRYCRTLHGLDKGPLLLAGALHLRGEVGLVHGRAELDGVVQLEQVLLVGQARYGELVAVDRCEEKKGKC